MSEKIPSGWGTLESGSPTPMTSFWNFSESVGTRRDELASKVQMGELGLKKAAEELAVFKQEFLNRQGESPALDWDAEVALMTWWLSQ